MVLVNGESSASVRTKESAHRVKLKPRIVSCVDNAPEPVGRIVPGKPGLPVKGEGFATREILKPKHVGLAVRLDSVLSVSISERVRAPASGVHGPTVRERYIRQAKYAATELMRTVMELTRRTLTNTSPITTVIRATIWETTPTSPSIQQPTQNRITTTSVSMPRMPRST